MKRSKPEWIPDQDAEGVFTCSVLAGVDGASPHREERPAEKRKILSIGEYVDGIRAGERSVLARAITLIESNSASDQTAAQNLLQKLLPHTGQSIRIGLSGIPGAGKSTFIECFGSFLCESGHKVAVLAIDPSSSKSGGSILGDKTRMEKLSQHPGSFIRPSPSGGVLGGVARKTRESIVACEAAGFDIIIIETLGVGQSEAAVRSMVDFFVFMTIAGAGDEIQHIKRGVLELVDLVVVNKADGDNLQAARLTQSELNIALHYAHSDNKGQRPEVLLCSALEGTGVKEIWNLLQRYEKNSVQNGAKEQRRKEQLLAWMESLLFEQLRNLFLENKGLQDCYKELQKKVLAGLISPVAAVEEIFAYASAAKFFNN